MRPAQRKAVEELCHVTLIYQAAAISKQLGEIVESMISEDASDTQIVAAIDRAFQDLKIHLQYSRSGA